MNYKVMLKPNADGFQTFEIREEIIDKFKNFINDNSLENGSDTPDFILAEYLFDCLKNFNETMRRRERWWAEPQKEEL